MMSMIELDRVWKSYNHYFQRGIKEQLIGRADARSTRFARKWAVREISLHVSSGRSLGIVGHNGSGKSTLLSLMLGTIAPDKGLIKRRGQIGAMLELGSGCHPELTGRENIFLNGSILGLRIDELRRKFKSIVEFSELGDSINLPMRTYSAGMSARLAFSVLAHAHRDVLLIDEIIAVGDANFQKKCVNYLTDFLEKGGTLVVVAHNLKILQDLCVEGIWLHEGNLIKYGPIDGVIAAYQGADIALKDDNQ